VEVTQIAIRSERPTRRFGTSCKFARNRHRFDGRDIDKRDDIGATNANSALREMAKRGMTYSVAKRGASRRWHG
jgi:hypothetical protein